MDDEPLISSPGLPPSGTITIPQLPLPLLSSKNIPPLPLKPKLELLPTIKETAEEIQQKNKILRQTIPEEFEITDTEKYSFTDKVIKLTEEYWIYMIVIGIILLLAILYIIWINPVELFSYTSRNKPFYTRYGNYYDNMF